MLKSTEYYEEIERNNVHHRHAAEIIGELSFQYSPEVRRSITSGIIEKLKWLACREFFCQEAMHFFGKVRNQAIKTHGFGGGLARRQYGAAMHIFALSCFNYDALGELTKEFPKPLIPPPPDMVSK